MAGETPANPAALAGDFEAGPLIELATLRACDDHDPRVGLGVQLPGLEWNQSPTRASVERYAAVKDCLSPFGYTTTSGRRLQRWNDCCICYGGRFTLGAGTYSLGARFR